MQIVRFRVMEPDVADPKEIHLGYCHETTIFCACGCHGTFDLSECEVLDSYEPSENDLGMMVGWPWWQGEDEDVECPVHDASCPYFHEGGCLLDHPETDCDDYIAMQDDPWEADDCDNDEGYDPYEGCYTGDC